MCHVMSLRQQNLLIDNKNDSSTPGHIKRYICNTGPSVMEVAIPSGIVLLVVCIIALIGCIIRKRPAKKQEETMNADENPVYGVYQLSETYERQYSTSEAVDNNDYYEQ